MKEGFLERLARQQSEERLQATIRECRRRLDAKEFPENEDTIYAFAAGFYSAQAYREEARVAREASSGRPVAFMLWLIAALCLAAIGLVWLAAPSNLSPAAAFTPLLVALLAIGGHLSWQYARRAEQKRLAAFMEVWG